MKCIFVLFINLRMLTSHPLTFLRGWKQHISPSMLNRLREVAKSQASSDQPSVKIVQLILTMENRVMVPTAPLKDPGRNPQIKTDDERMELLNSFKKMMVRYHEDGFKSDSKRRDSENHSKRSSRAWINRYDRVKCPSCDYPPHRAIVTNCNHLYCEDCFNELSDKNGNKETSVPVCLNCKQEIQSFAACGPLDDCFFTPVEPLHEGKKRKQKYGSPCARKKRSPTKFVQRTIVDFSGKHESDSSSEDEEMEEDVDWFSTIGSQMPGAKLDKVYEIIEKWVDEDENDDVKIVIFVQFTTTLSIIRDKCQSKEWKCLTVCVFLHPSPRLDTN